MMDGERLKSQHWGGGERLPGPCFPDSFAELQVQCRDHASKKQRGEWSRKTPSVKLWPLHGYYNYIWPKVTYWQRTKSEHTLLGSYKPLLYPQPMNEIGCQDGACEAGVLHKYRSRTGTVCSQNSPWHRCGSPSLTRMLFLHQGEARFSTSW